ncbi:hypothetical protein CCICO_10990 [Corynebacterium ciconiae DSM 44920]|uniref:hypothetical protein n=1 Tax=Corynebacterium ciconiae TaxID=227319 RepID=UPI00037F3F3C|nr:hypothetical protein [Corynebacterium ciconiae]WKD62193.1 hypothetical protein CCICO_10990 [Corynebacterium ciconiae DSM 44920]
MDVFRNPAIHQHINDAYASIATAHRKRANLRDAAATSAHSALVGAQSLSKIAGGSEVNALEVYGVLTPALADTFQRAPLQVMAKVDRLAGGEGLPERHASRLTALAPLVGQVETCALLHGEILGHHIFGERSMVVGFATVRLNAMASGLDPKGVAMPEPYLLRDPAAHTALIEGYCRGEVDALAAAHFQAWVRGGEEAARVAERF